ASTPAQIGLVAAAANIRPHGPASWRSRLRCVNPACSTRKGRRCSMRWNMLLGALVVSAGLSTQSFGFELLDRMLGLNDCGCNSCCEPKCCEKSCAAPSCAAPACESCAAPACAAPACEATCAAAPSCGCDSGCGNECGCGRGHHRGGCC